MSTKKRRILLGKLEENSKLRRKKPLGKLMQESGFSKNVSRSPARVIKSKGFQTMLREAGLTEQLIIDSYKQAILQKPKGDISWEIKRKHIEDLANYLGLAPKKEERQQNRIALYIEKFLLVKGADKEDIKKLKGKIAEEIGRGEAQEGEVIETEDQA